MPRASVISLTLAREHSISVENRPLPLTENFGGGALGWGRILSDKASIRTKALSRTELSCAVFVTGSEHHAESPAVPEMWPMANAMIRKICWIGSKTGAHVEAGFAAGDHIQHAGGRYGAHYLEQSHRPTTPRPGSLCQLAVRRKPPDSSRHRSWADPHSPGGHSGHEFVGEPRHAARGL
jgi:hypothetical protein